VRPVNIVVANTAGQLFVEPNTGFKTIVSGVPFLCFTDMSFCVGKRIILSHPEHPLSQTLTVFINQVEKLLRMFGRQRVKFCIRVDFEHLNRATD
jgi:hypothetical protein